MFTENKDDTFIVGVNVLREILPMDTNVSQDTCDSVIAEGLVVKALIDEVSVATKVKEAVVDVLSVRIFEKVLVRVVVVVVILDEAFVVAILDEVEDEVVDVDVTIAIDVEKINNKYE